MKFHSAVFVCCIGLAVISTVVAHAQLVGGNTYPINGTENPPVSFATMGSAGVYLNANGVTGTGDVILEFDTGYTGETDTVAVRTISGTSASTRVVFRPAAGFTVNMNVAGAASPYQYAIRLGGTSYVTLDGRAGGTGNSRDWTVTCTGTNGLVAVRLDNAPGSMTGIVIRNLIMQADAPSATLAILYIHGNTSNTMSDVIIEENLIRSNPAAGPRGAGMFITVNNAGNTGIVIRNNIVTQFYYRGIYFSGGCPGLLVYGNEIYHTAPITQPTSTEFSGIHFASTTSPGSKIYNNFIHDIQLTNGSTSGAHGISTLTVNSSGDPLKIYNNRIQIGAGIQATTVPIEGIYQSGTTTTYLIDVEYNSVYIGGVATAGTANSAAFRKASSNSLNIRNNIFFNARSNSGGTGTHWGIMVNNTNFTSISNNDYYAAGTGGVLGTTTGTTAGNQSTIGAWLAAVPTDAASISGNPNYVNPTAAPPDLKINTAIPSPLDSAATPIAGITTDFEGDARNGTTPDIGADEFQSGSTIVVGVPVTANWNIVSLPVGSPTPNDSVKGVFINSSIPYAFAFVGGYVQRYVLANGPGYWIKSASAYTQNITGERRDTLTVLVSANWNMIGSVSSPVDTSAASVTPSIPGLRTSNFFRYASGYVVTSTIEPGLGYWVKTSAAGSFFVHLPADGAAATGGGVKPLTPPSQHSLEALNTLTITDSRGGTQTLYFGVDAQKTLPVAMYTMPPVPPTGAFDARFETPDGGSMVQTYNGDGGEEYGVSVQSDAYPLTVSWNVLEGLYELRDGQGGVRELRGKGSMRIVDARATRLVLKLLGGGAGIPSDYALMQNYPNPFNPTTSITFALPVASRVDVEVYNVLGQKVATLVSNDLAAGYHVVEWIGTGNSGLHLGSGVYFLRLAAEGATGRRYSETRKVMLMK